MTSPIGIGYGNLIDDATLTGGSWSGYPLAYLQDGALSMVARSSSADEADTIIDFDHGSAVSMQVLWVPAHNLSSSATFVVERGTTQGGTDVYAGEELPVWAFTPLDGIYSGRHFGFGLVMPAANSARWTRLRIINTTNPDGYVQISRPFLGSMFLPTYPPTELKDKLVNHSSIERLLNGTDWASKRRPLRSAALVFGALTYAEGSVFKEIQRIHDLASELVYIAHTYDRARQQQDSFVGLIDDDFGEMSYPFWEHNGVPIRLLERGGAP